MSNKQSGCDAQVSKEDPKLLEGAKADSRDREEADPFAADHGTQGEADKGQPRPPLLGERLMLVLVGKANPEEGSGSREEYEG